MNTFQVVNYIGHNTDPYWLTNYCAVERSLRIFFFFFDAPTLGILLPLLEHRAEFPQFLDQGQSVGLLGRVISSSQGLSLPVYKHRKTHIHKH
jgi:hypothetical protein